MDNQTLCTLILEIYHCHGANKPYDNTLEALAYGLDQIPQLKLYLGSGYLPYYDQALPMTMNDIQKNINQFFIRYGHLNFSDRQPKNAMDIKEISKAFLNWVVMILKRDCQDEKRKAKRRQGSGKGWQNALSLETPVGEGQTLEDLIPADIDPMRDLITAETIRENERRYQELLALLPEKLACHSKKYPQCHCYEIFARQYLWEPKQTFKEIALELNMAQGTITGHWHRKCKPLLDELAQHYYR